MKITIKFKWEDIPFNEYSGDGYIIKKSTGDVEYDYECEVCFYDFLDFIKE